MYLLKPLKCHESVGVDSMIFLQLLTSHMQNFSYVIGDEKAGLAAVVDPAGEVDRILMEAEKRRLKIVYIINTHAHSDHTMGNHKLKSKTGAKTVMHEEARVEEDLSVRDGDEIVVGGLKIKVIHTPGHTPEGICLLVDKKLLTGDTLFVGECGRTDLLGGDPGQLYDSLFNKLMKLEDDMMVYPGHDYGAKPSSTIGYEREHNYVLRPRTKEEFVHFMAEGT